MKNLIFAQKNHFNEKTTAVLIAVSVLLSVFIPISIAMATYGQPGDHCGGTGDPACRSDLSCIYNRCLALAGAFCNGVSDCAGNETDLMGCNNNQCCGRHAYPCGDTRDDPACCPGFHCDISNPGYHYCEGDHPTAPNLIINKLVDKSNVLPGDEIVYTINYANIGDGSAASVVVKDTFNYVNQQYLTFISANPTPTSGIDTWSIGTLNAGQSGQITIRASVGTNVPIGTTEIKNRATIQSNEISLIYSNCANFFVTRAGNPALTITKSVDKTTAAPGDEIVYTLNYQNTGQGAASNVVVTDPFNNLNQNYLTFVSSTPSPSSGTDTWQIGTLNPGQSGQITIRARISNSVPGGNTEIKNRATIDSTETALQYSNYVSTFVNISTSLDIDKLVRNVTTGGSFADSVNANPSDEVEFSLTIKATGNSSVINVRVWDNLPYRLSYISGSTTVDGSYKEDGITIGGIYIGDLSTQQTKVIKFRARVAEASVFNIGMTALTNYGYTSGNGVASVYDQATVQVKKDSGCSPSLQINKQVRNITQGSGYWTDSVYANPGDEIEVLIRINSVGNETAENSRIKDTLPAKLNYISGSTTVGGSYKEDGIIYSNGISLGSLYVGDFREIKFRTRLAQSSEFGSVSLTLINYAYAWADKTCGEISDSAQIMVNRQENQTRAISISKLGRNVSRGQIDFLDSFLASSSEEVEFSIQVTNTGNIDLNNVKVSDNLPNNISIISGSTTIDGVSWGGDVIGAGLNFGILRQGQTKTIKFRAKIASEDKFGAGSTTLINTAYAVADNVSQISDQASVIIYRPGQILGASYVKTGANSMALLILMIMSCFVSFFVYCRLREEKLLEALNSNKGNRFYKWLIKFYFKLKFVFTVKMIRFKKVYW